MHGFRKGRFRYIHRSLPCIPLSSHLYLSKMYHLAKWKCLWRVSTLVFTLKQHFFFLVVTREEAGGSEEQAVFYLHYCLCLLPQDTRPSAALGAPGATGSESRADELITQRWSWPPGAVSWPEKPTAGSSSSGLVASPCSPHWPERRASWPHLHYWACALTPQVSPVLSQPLVR